MINDRNGGAVSTPETYYFKLRNIRRLIFFSCAPDGKLDVATVQEIVMRNALVFWSYDTASYLCYSTVERLGITETLFQLERERA